MGGLTIAFVNTDSKEIPLGDNDKIAWIKQVKNDGTEVLFFPQRKA